MKYSEQLILGEKYSRKQLSSLLNEKTLDGSREGIYYCKNEKTFLIFTDLISKGAFTYNDYFEGDFFHWDSQNPQHINTPRIQDIVKHNVEVLLFCRLNQKVKGVTQPLIYCGRLKYYEHDKKTANPVHIIFESLDYDDESTNQELLRLWQWVPGSKGSPIDKTKTVSKKRIANYKPPTETERVGLVTSRVGQGYYRQQILNRWNRKCAVKDVSIESILIASHILPWKDSNVEQRLDVGNGILLSPNLDSLFDKHLISFGDDGKILISNKISKEEYLKLGISIDLRLVNVYEDMKYYLKLHRDKFYENNEDKH